MTIFIRILWMVLAGIWLALAYALAGLVSGVATGGAPVARASLRMATYAFWPFGRSLTDGPSEVKGASSVGSLTGAVWLVTSAWWLALVHVVVGLVLCLTVIGLPFGIATLTLLPVTLGPSSVRFLPEPAPRAAPEPVRIAPSRVLAAA